MLFFSGNKSAADLKVNVALHLYAYRAFFFTSADSRDLVSAPRITLELLCNSEMETHAEYLSRRANTHILHFIT